MTILDWRFPEFLQPIDQGALVVVSDYSGQHREATHESYSFLLTTRPKIEAWTVKRDAFRAEWLPDGRRMSFKRLSDGIRRRALGPFLDLTFGLPGNLVTVMIDKQLGSFCGDSSELANLFPDCFPDSTPRRTIEKMFTLSSLLAMVIVGFRREDQESYWISDEDEALDTHEKREGFARLASYLTFGFARWREPADQWFGTTGSPNAPPWAEDLAAVPDLMAGATCVLSSVLPRFFGRKEELTRIVNSGGTDDTRARFILDWLDVQQRPLRSTLLRLERDRSGDVRSSYQIHRGNLPRQ